MTLEKMLEHSIKPENYINYFENILNVYESKKFPTGFTSDNYEANFLDALRRGWVPYCDNLKERARTFLKAVKDLNWNIAKIEGDIEKKYGTNLTIHGRTVNAYATFIVWAFRSGKLSEDEADRVVGELNKKIEYRLRTDYYEQYKALIQEARNIHKEAISILENKMQEGEQGNINQKA